MGEEQEWGRGVTVTGSKWASGEGKGQREGANSASASPRGLSLSCPPLVWKTRPELGFTAEQIFPLLLQVKPLSCSQRGLGSAASSQGGGQLGHQTRGT